MPFDKHDIDHHENVMPTALVRISQMQCMYCSPLWCSNGLHLMVSYRLVHKVSPKRQQSEDA